MVVMHLQVVQQGGVMEGSAGLVETTPDLEACMVVRECTSFHE